MIALRPFQREFKRRAMAPGVDTAALSLPRGNGKSWLAADLLADALTPGHETFRPGTESVIVAASLEQARIPFRFVRQRLEDTSEYSFQDAGNRISIRHKPTNTRCRVIGSNGKTAMGLVQCPLVVADEPGAWEIIGGGLVHDAIMTAMGKPNSPLKAVFLGTMAPGAHEGHWYHSMVTQGTGGSRYVMALQGDPKRWDQWSEIRRCNPLTAVSAEFRAKLLEERDEARRDTRLRARFLSYRLNVPSGDESTVLLTVDDWERTAARPVPERDGLPIVGIDLGGGRSWSAAVAMWPSGRVEATACAPGIPDIQAQEKRDLVPKGMYSRLAETGVLRVADGLRVQPPAFLWDCVRELWGGALALVCDRFRLPDLFDATGGQVPLIPRVTRWSESSEDIRALRKFASDGPLSISPESRDLIAASLSVAQVKTDDAGNSRLIKRGSNNTARDDVAVALTHAAGQIGRMLTVPDQGEYTVRNLGYAA